MKSLVSHLFRENREEIVAKSRLHCHAHGLHSIMLLESPGKTVRLFVTDEDHVLHHNYSLSDGEPLSIGFHPHHCNLTLQCVKGNVDNWRTSLHPEGLVLCERFRYQSAITCGKGSFVRAGYARLHSDGLDELHASQSVFMAASQLHTVACPQGEVAAWFVFEGREASKPNRNCYSNARLDTLDFSKLYQPTTEDDVTRLLLAAGLL